MPQPQPSTELIQIVTDHGIDALKADMTETLDSIEFNLGGEISSVADLGLERITVPTGASPMWILEGVKGPKAIEALHGVITLAQPHRAYWKIPLGNGGESRTPPDCASEDGNVGVGDPGGDCHVCPLNVFGSDGRGKACAETKWLYLLRSGNTLPSIVVIPPTSLANCRKYLSRLYQQNNLKYIHALTTLSLRQQKNADGIVYSEVQFQLDGILDDTDSVHAMQFHNFLRKILGAGPRQIAG